MSRSGRKIVQYLEAAHAAEVVLARDMQAQIAVTPPGRYRTALARHLKETIRHADRLHDRLVELGATRGPLQAGLDTASSLAGRLLSISRAPLEFVRGPGGEERILRNASDTCASEAVEIAAYTALERLARDADDRQTAKLASWIRADEEAMLKKVLAEIPGLTHAVAKASFEIVAPKAIPQTAGTSAVHDAGGGQLAIGRPIRGSAGPDRRASAADRRRRSAATQPRRREPWPGYDELTAVEVITQLDGASEARVKRARAYEKIRKQRSTVIQATERELARS